MSEITRRAFAAGSALCLTSASVAADGYPSRPVTLVVPFPPGGTTDAVARIVGREMARILGQPILFDNKAGGNGSLGSAVVARAAPDGYTLLASGVGTNAINHSFYAGLPYDSRRDFAHVTLLASAPNVLVVSRTIPVRSLRELIDLSKANPGRYRYASPGIGSSGHLAMELLKQRTGADLAHVPYGGGGPALNDVIDGQIPAMFVNQESARPPVEAGTVRALGVASPERNALFPDVPTIAEQGVPGFSAVSWVGLSAPAGTAPTVVDRLYRAAAQALADAGVRDALSTNGFVIDGLSPDRFTRYVSDEIAKWAEVVQASGARPN